MRKILFSLVAFLLLTACDIAVVPISLPPEGTTATIKSAGERVKYRPVGSVAEVHTSTFRSQITVTNTPPWHRRNGPYRGETVLGCNRVGDVWLYLDTGYAAPNVCRFMRATNARPRSTYRAADGRCYTIMEFGVGFSKNFTAIPGSRCRLY